MTVRSNFQLRQSITNHLRNAFALDMDDDASIDYACRMIGEQHRALVTKIHASMKPTEPV